ncbi:hypothetical protein, partial [Azotobacter beijerinckii]|uniref:hypothetical protein n=1 Tax=Azotobacter beijerinckii TaxID=170623 RepID=UPI0029532949
NHRLLDASEPSEQSQLILVGTLSIAGSPDRLQVHSQLMLVGRFGYSQLIPVENRLDCRSDRFRLQVVTSRGLTVTAALARGEAALVRPPAEGPGNGECREFSTALDTAFRQMVVSPSTACSPRHASLLVTSLTAKASNPMRCATSPILHRMI